MYSNHEYSFHPISDKVTKVTYSTQQKVRVVSELEVNVNDTSAFSLRDPFFTALTCDLIDFASAIFVADWHSRRKLDLQTHIHCEIPLRLPQIFGETPVYEDLQRLLYWYTEDDWSFTFIKRDVMPRGTELQRSVLPIQRREVALWSSGLDSYAGLCNRINDCDDFLEFLLIGTGSNDFMMKKQSEVASKFQSIFPAKSILLQIPIRVVHTHMFSRRRNNRFRLRGLAFILIGAAVAFLEGQTELNVYENGVGAINLPLSAAEVGLDHPKSVHPYSLVQLSDWLSRLFSQKFRIHNPFLFTTKAHMCMALEANSQLQAIAFDTVSCDRLPHAKGRQCGICTSCVLRRQALAAAGIDDQTYYLHQPAGRNCDIQTNHWSAMIQQVRTLDLSLSAVDPWKNLVKHFPDLILIEQQTYMHENISRDQFRQRLINLFRNYVSEWRTAVHLLHPSIVAL